MQINHKSDRKAISSILLLILITLEYYIRGGTYWAFGKFYVVLILIILEYYIRAKFPKTIYLDEVRVLILIILEYYIRVPFGLPDIGHRQRLNPYYTGILYTRTKTIWNNKGLHQVLILIILEYYIRDRFKAAFCSLEARS